MRLVKLGVQSFARGFAESPSRYLTGRVSGIVYSNNGAGLANSARKLIPEVGWFADPIYSFLGVF